MANAESDSTRAGNQDDRGEVNFPAGLLLLFNLIVMGHSDRLATKFLPWLPAEDFASLGKAAGWVAFVALFLSRPSGLGQWLRMLAGVLVIDLVGLALVVVSALAFGMTGLIPDVDAMISEPRIAIADILAAIVFAVVIGGLGKSGLLPGFRWPGPARDDDEPVSASDIGWLPPRFVNFMAAVVVCALSAGYSPALLIWISANWPDSTLVLIHREFAGLPITAAAIVTLGTGLFAPGGLRPWPMTGLVALIGAVGMAALMVLLALTSPLWAWSGAGETALSAIVTGLPALALIPLGIAAWGAQKSGEAEAAGDAA